MRKMLLFFAFISFAGATVSNGQNFDVGVFYMPFWHNLHPEKFTGQLNHNWRIIGDHDQWVKDSGLSRRRVRIPLNIYTGPVWYDETLKEVTMEQLALMKQYSIDFVIYDSYWNWSQSNQTYYASWNQVLENWREPYFNNHGIEMAIMWANEFSDLITPGCDLFFKKATDGGLNRMIDYWKPFLLDSRYKRIDGKPVFYIYYSSFFANNVSTVCDACKTNYFFTGVGIPDDKEERVKRLLSYIESRVGVDLYFVAVMSDQVQPLSSADKYYWLHTHVKDCGYDAQTTYTYKYYDSNDLIDSYNYNTMQQVYQKYYNYILQYTQVDYQVPVKSGYNSSALHLFRCKDDDNDGLTNGQEAGDSYYTPQKCFEISQNQYKRHKVDGAISDPVSFAAALQTAKSYASAPAYLAKTHKRITLCCWNEHAEGSIIEPTGGDEGPEWGWRYQYLEKIHQAFPNPSGGRVADIQDENLELIEEESFSRFQVYPNPAYDEAAFTFAIEADGNVSIQILNSSGQVVKEVVNEMFERGSNQVRLNISEMAAGLYFCKIKAANFEETRKLLIEK